MAVEFNPPLPPGTRQVGDPGHTPDHNAIVAALHNLAGHINALEQTPTPLPTGGEPYGPAVNFDALGNSQLGGTDSGAVNVWVSFFFRAKYSSPLTAFRAYWLDEDYPGYGGGNGGTFNITVEADNGSGAPSGTPLALVQVAPSSLFPLITFPAPATLVAGNIYHLVFKNVDASPTVNFSSVNMCWNKLPVSPRQPRWPDADWGFNRKYLSPLNIDWGGEPSENARYAPILDLTYGNGQHQGNGYMEVEVGSGSISGDYRVRTRFRPSRTVVSKGAMVRVAREDGGSGALTITLKGPGGTLGTKTVSSGIPTSDRTDDNASTGVYVGGDWAAPVTLSAGQEYVVELSGPSGALLWSRGIQHGAGWGFDPATFFAEESVMEQSSNGGSSWAEPAGTVGASALQFYLT